MAKATEKKLSNAKEVTLLLKRIREGATSSTAPLGEVLRLCMRLGKQLKNEELVRWARMEASGYSKAEDLPDYRKMPTESRGHFSGPFGSGLRNAHIPNSVIEEKHREVLCNMYMFEPVNELENLAKGIDSKDNTLSIPWSGDIIAYYQRKEIYSAGMTLSSAWRVMTREKIVGVLETIRTRVLDFILEIEEELGITESEEHRNLAITQPQPQTIQQIFIEKIYGGNFAVGQNQDVTQQTISVNKGDFASLKKYLKQLGIEEKEIGSLEKAMAKDNSQKTRPGPAVKSWLAKVKKIGLKGSLSVASNVAGSLLANAIMKFYGLG